MEKPREHTDQEVIEAWKLAFGDDPDQWEDNPYFYDGWESAQAWIEEGETIGQQLPNAVFGLALGILPDGWEIDGGRRGGRAVRYVNHKAHISICTGRSSFRTAPNAIYMMRPAEAVRSGQAAAACLLLAAHVELERRRKGVDNG